MKGRDEHIAEDDLISYQMGDAGVDARIAEHLEQCPQCAAAAESIAETLRVFSAEPVPPANLDHAWARLRGSLPPLDTPPRPRRLAWAHRLVWAVPACLAVALATLALHGRAIHKPGAPAYANHHVGPLTEQPTGANAQGMNAHLDSAERLLTEVNHSSGTLDPGVRAQAHELSLRNALYVEQAEAKGDVAEASLLEDLGRVLTTLEHDADRDQARDHDRVPREHPQGWHLRLQLNTDGLLLDLRILQQNDGQGNDSQGNQEHPDKKDKQ